MRRFTDFQNVKEVSQPSERAARASAARIDSSPRS